mgnify:CR=1 FL=1
MDLGIAPNGPKWPYLDPSGWPNSPPRRGNLPKWGRNRVPEPQIWGPKPRIWPQMVQNGPLFGPPFWPKSLIFTLFPGIWTPKKGPKMVDFGGLGSDLSILYTFARARIMDSKAF